MTTNHEPIPTPPPTHGFLRRRWKIVVPVAAAVTAVAAWLAFGFFGVQYLFIDDRVDEAAPVFASGAGAESGQPADAPTDDAGAPADTSAASIPATASQSTAPPTTVSQSTAPPTTVSQSTAPPTSAAAAVITAVAAGDFIDRGHPTRGVASVLTDGTEQRFLRFEDFETDNGPDLNVYLVAAAADAPEGTFDDDFVDLGTLKGNIGSQNYEIPPEVDLDHHSTVVIWCVRFAVAFGAADLM